MALVAWIDDVEDLGKTDVIKLNYTKTKKERSVSITGKLYFIFLKYADPSCRN